MSPADDLCLSYADWSKSPFPPGVSLPVQPACGSGLGATRTSCQIPCFSKVCNLSVPLPDRRATTKVAAGSWANQRVPSRHGLPMSLC